METDTRLIYETKKLLFTKYKNFASELSSARISYRTDLKYHTAATDGKNIYFDPGYLAGLSDDDKIFLIAHELMHIKFRHMFRLFRNGAKKDQEVWNYVTDAIINANLERDGLKIKKGYVNRPDALNYSAEEFYDIVIREKERQQQNKKQEGDNSSDNGEGKEEYNENWQGDDHSLWEEAYQKKMKNENNDSSGSEAKDVEQSQKECVSYDEKSEFESNRQERKERALEEYNKRKESMLKKLSDESKSEEIKLGDVGSESDIISWELLLRREIEKTEVVWGNRRSIAENNYAYRLEEIDLEEDAETEAMIDVSGSVKLNMVKAFLRTLKSLLKHSKLKVGCFNERYWGMVEVKTNRDIDNFIIPEGARGTSARTEDWDLAVRSFTKKNEINKIVFTDGIPGPGNMPKDDLKGQNVIWIVYGNKNFKPCCGKVIHIPKEQLTKLNVTYVPDDTTKKIL